MEDLSLHILDIAENSISAGAKNIEIIILEDTNKDILKIEIIDNGKGMSEDQIQKVTNPFFTSRTTRKVGLGLPLLNQAAKMANGTMNIKSTVGKGTHVSVTFQHSHIDRQPLGNMADTIMTVVASNPDIDIKYIHKRNGKQFVFDWRELKKELIKKETISTSVLTFVKKYIIDHTANL